MSIGTWMGQEVEGLPREKLLEIIQQLSNEVEAYHGLSREIALGKIERIKRGEAK